MSLANRVTGFAKAHITSATTTQVKVGTGTLKRIVVNTPVSGGTITIQDAASNTNTFAVVTSTADLKPFFVDFDVRFSTGLRIVTTEAQDITVVYE